MNRRSFLGAIAAALVVDPPAAKAPRVVLVQLDFDVHHCNSVRYDVRSTLLPVDPNTGKAWTAEALASLLPMELAARRFIASFPPGSTGVWTYLAVEGV